MHCSHIISSCDYHDNSVSEALSACFTEEHAGSPKRLNKEPKIIHKWQSLISSPPKPNSIAHILIQHFVSVFVIFGNSG